MGTLTMPTEFDPHLQCTGPSNIFKLLKWRRGSTQLDTDVLSLSTYTTTYATIHHHFLSEEIRKKGHSLRGNDLKPFAVRHRYLSPGHVRALCGDLRSVWLGHWAWTSPEQSYSPNDQPNILLTDVQAAVLHYTLHTTHTHIHT